MGIIEKIKGLFRDPLWDEIVAAYDLKRTEETWRPNQVEGRVGVQRITLEFYKARKTTWFLGVGEMRDEEEHESILIERIVPGVRFEDEYDPEEDLNRVPGLQGSELARHYVLAGASPSGDHSILSTAAIKDELPKLWEVVDFVEFYPAPKTVVLGLLRETLTRENFDRVLNRAISAVKALGG